MALIDPTLLAELRSRGYTGGDTIEELMVPINNYLNARGIGKLNNIAWWILAKDEGVLKNKNFQQVIAEKYINLFA